LKYCIFRQIIPAVYEEEVVKKHENHNNWKRSCSVTEKIQPKYMLFKTNYRSISETEKKINFLEKNLKKFSFE
jgi:hypothetical protein|tara:strand:+ start:1164 stop:1382 length:219 start_codon:yes stop_codon:yes gene_type:complete